MVRRRNIVLPFQFSWHYWGSPRGTLGLQSSYAVLSEESGLCPQAEDGFQELESHPRDHEPSHPSPQQLGSVQIDRGFLLAQLSKDYGLDAISEP